MSTEDLPPRGRGSSRVSDPLVGTVFHRKYEVLERLGAGGFGTVYRVRNLRLDTTEALKVIHRHVVLDEAQLERFRQEAQLLRRLGMRSPHIPPVHDFDQDMGHGVWYFTMELVPGNSLRQILVQQGALPVPRALSLMRQVCDALAVAHGEEKPVVHRDLKPDNIMVVSEEAGERAQILDFGIARILGQTGLTSVHGGVPGSAGYIAPEQMGGETDPRTDLFATGVTLHAVLTGRDPWLGKRVGEPLVSTEANKLLRRALFDEPIPLRSVDGRLPSELEEIVLRLLQKNPEDRLQSATELDAALARIGTRPDGIRSGARQTTPSLHGAAKTGRVVYGGVESTRGESGVESDPSPGIPSSPASDRGDHRILPLSLLAWVRSVPRVARWSLSLFLVGGLLAILWRVSPPWDPNALRALVGAGETREAAPSPSEQRQSAEGRASGGTSRAGGDSPVPLPRDSLTALLEAAGAAYRRGAWTSPSGENVAHYLDRILVRNPTDQQALALRDSLTRDFERLIHAASRTGNAGRARQIAQRCLDAVPGAAACREAAR